MSKHFFHYFFLLYWDAATLNINAGQRKLHPRTLLLKQHQTKGSAMTGAESQPWCPVAAFLGAEP